MIDDSYKLTNEVGMIKGKFLSKLILIIKIVKINK